MYSRTRSLTASQAERMHKGVSNVDSTTNSMEMPSTPM